MTDIIAGFATEWNATAQIAAEPTKNNACAKLHTSCFPLGARDAFSRAVRAFHHDWVPLLVDSWHPFVLSELFSLKEF